MLKVKISGYYRSGKDTVDYDTVVTMPECDENYILSNIINRVLYRHFANADKRFTAHGKCWVDKIEKDDKLKPSYVGKNIKSFEWDDIEELAIAHCLKRVPLYRACSLREAREVLYKEYMTEVKGKKLDDNFSYGDAADFVVESGKTKAKSAKESDVDEVIRQEFDE